MKNAIIIHGTGGTPESNWFRWLEAELKVRGLQVFLPALPNTQQPSLRDNVDFVRSNCPFSINEDTLIVGHSSGAILALILAQENDVPVGSVIALSVFHDNSLKWEALNRLFDIDFAWPQIKAKAGKLLFLHSDTDPYVPLEQAKYVADNCGAEMLVIPNQGHFSLEQNHDYKQFPKLLEILEEMGVSTRSANSKSAGGIVLNTLNQVILVRQEEGTWSFPKGHVEEGENEERAARREIYEETGITKLDFVKQLGSYQRSSLDKQPEEKTITLFLYRTTETRTKPKSADSIETRWVDLPTVAALLSHPKDAEYFNRLQNDLQRIVIVNDRDEIIGHKERAALSQEDIYRVSSLWVTNTNGDNLLAQRHHAKKHHPNLWGPAVAGTIDEGETYDENIIKEAEEEIGLKNIQPKKSQKIRVTGEHNHFTQWYTLVCDKPAEDFVIQEDEVEQVKWFTREELARELQEHPEKYLRGMKWNLDNL